MPSVDVVDKTGAVRATAELSDAVFGAPVNGALLHQAVVRELGGRRAGTHDTKGRSEVSGGGRKPWKQKGTGRARQGSIRATQWKGGGRPFGPTPRRYTQAMPRSARRAALRAALSDALASGRLTVVDAAPADGAKTKSVVGFLKSLGVADGTTLLVVAELTDALRRGSRNVAGLTVARPGQVTVVGLMRHRHVVVERPALDRWQETLGS